MAISVLNSIKPSPETTVEIVSPVTQTANEIIASGAVNDPIAYDWAAVLPANLKKLAEEEWAAKIDPSKGDAEISGFAADIMAEIKKITKEVLRHTAVSYVPEATAIFSAFLDDLNKVDYNYKFRTPNFLVKLIQQIGLLKDQLVAFLESIKNLDQKLEGMEATITWHIMKLIDFLSVLKRLKDEYKKMVPYMFAATYSMGIVVKREDANLKDLQAKSQKFKDEHNGQANPIIDSELEEKSTQLDLCRQRLFQLAYQAAKGYIMVPVIEVSMKAARIILSEMQNTISSTMVDIRAALTVIVAQKAIGDAVEAQKKADAVASRAQKALGDSLGRTVVSIGELNATKQQKLTELREFATAVDGSIRIVLDYSAGLTDILVAVDKAMTDIANQHNTTLMKLGVQPVIQNDL